MATFKGTDESVVAEAGTPDPSPSPPPSLHPTRLRMTEGRPRPSSERDRPRIAASGRRARRVKGFYEGALDEADAADFAAAYEVQGIDDEIALLRVRIKEAVAAKGEALKPMLRGVEILARLVASRYRLAPSSADELSAALRASLKAAGIEAGWKGPEGGEEGPGNAGRGGADE
jgi:hypothetical protein